MGCSHTFSCLQLTELSFSLPIFSSSILFVQAEDVVKPFVMELYRNRRIDRPQVKLLLKHAVLALVKEPFLHWSRSHVRGIVNVCLAKLLKGGRATRDIASTP